VADFLGIGGVRITIVPSPPTPSIRPLGEGLLVGEPTTLEAARRRVPWTVRIPTAPDLGTPQVYFGVGFPGGQVSLVYPAGPELPVTRETGVGLLLTEFRASLQEPLDQQPFIQKLVGSGTTIEAVTVNGHPGFWLSGAPHEIFYIGPNGEPIPDTIRLSGNVLLWQQGDVTFRLESALTKDEAIRIAGSAR